MRSSWQINRGLRKLGAIPEKRQDYFVKMIREFILAGQQEN